MLSSSTPGLFIFFIPIVPKKFYVDLTSETKNLLTTLDRDTNDGIIYTSEYGDIVYKWKFPDKMSIDFQVRLNKDKSIRNEMYYYDLFVGAENYKNKLYNNLELN